MMTDRELMQTALDALESDCGATKFGASEALRARLAQPEPEPVAYDVNGATVYIKPPVHNGKYLTGYTAPPQREWQGLMDEDWIIGKRSADYIAGAEWAEAKLKEKNN